MAEANLPYTFTNGTGNIIDATQVNANFEELEDAVNSVDNTNAAPSVTFPPSATVTSLPGSPANGQIVYYQTSGMATDGVVWALRYNASSSSTYKWEFMGGSPWIAAVGTLETFGSAQAAYTDLSTAGPSRTAPLAGDYIASFGAYVAYSRPNPNTSGAAYMGIEQTGVVNATDATALLVSTLAASSGSGVSGAASVGRSIALTVATGGTSIKAKYRCDSEAAAFQSRYLSILPVRVG